jgi:hypothetical protein
LKQHLFDKYCAGFHKSWAHGGKRTQIWEQIQKVGRKAQIHDAKLGKKDGRTAKISSIGRKLLYEIHPWSTAICHT